MAWSPVPTPAHRGRILPQPPHPYTISQEAPRPRPWLSPSVLRVCADKQLSLSSSWGLSLQVLTSSPQAPRRCVSGGLATVRTRAESGRRGGAAALFWLPRGGGGGSWEGGLCRRRREKGRRAGWTSWRKGSENVRTPASGGLWAFENRNVSCATFHCVLCL